MIVLGAIVAVLVVGVGGVVSVTGDSGAERAAQEPQANALIASTTAPSTDPAPVETVAPPAPEPVPVTIDTAPTNPETAALAQQVAMAAGGLALGIQSAPDPLAALGPLLAGQAVLEPLLDQLGQSFAAIPSLTGDLAPLAGDLMAAVGDLQRVLAPIQTGQFPDVSALVGAINDVAAAAGAISHSLE